MINWLRGIGIAPDMAYGASLASIALSLLLWFVPRGGTGSERDRPERLAIFVGLWAPTLALFAHALEAEAMEPVQAVALASPVLEPAA